MAIVKFEKGTPTVAKVSCRKIQIIKLYLSPANFATIYNTLVNSFFKHLTSTFCYEKSGFITGA
jgi:hypothetical protein